jgi:hypothetical protein
LFFFVKDIFKYDKKGDLKPLEKKIIEISVSPKVDMIFNSIFEMIAENGNIM